MNSIPVVSVGPAHGLMDDVERLHAQVSVVRRCEALTELLAVCQSGLATAAVLASETEGLTGTLLDRLSAVGVSVLAVTDQENEVTRLRALGVTTLPSTTDAPELASAIEAAVVRRVRPALDAAGNGRGTGKRFGMDSGGDGGASGSGSASQPAKHVEYPRLRERARDAETHARVTAESEPRAGKVIAVWGPVGAPGRTVVAANVAAELAASGLSVMLIDADTYGASMAATLGLLDESAGLAQACRLADQGLLTEAALAEVAITVTFSAGALSLLSGLTRADRWPELRQGAVDRVLALTRTMADVVVIDCGFCLEADEELSYDTVAPRRNATTLASVVAADLVLAVGQGDAIGIPRLIRGVGELAAVAPGTSVTAVANKVRKEAVGRAPQRALAAAWDRFGPKIPLTHFLPWDSDALGLALKRGQLLLESAPTSELRLALQKLSHDACAPAQQMAATPVISATA